jgi:hypothetical protein
LWSSHVQSTTTPEDKVFSSLVSWQALRLTLPQDPKLLSEAWTIMMALIPVKRPSFFPLGRGDSGCVMPSSDRSESKRPTIMQSLLGFGAVDHHRKIEADDSMQDTLYYTSLQLHCMTRQCEYSMFVPCLRHPQGSLRFHAQRSAEGAKH